MTKITVKVDGMMCGMCEAHVNDAVRRAYPGSKVSSSHKRGETVIITDGEVDETNLRSIIGQTGYTVTGVTREPYEKRGFFSFFKK